MEWNREGGCAAEFYREVIFFQKVNNGDSNMTEGIMTIDHRAIAKGLIDNRKKISIDEYVGLAEAFTAAGGKLVQGSFDDDDWCGTGRIPWPPKGVDAILEQIGKLGGRGGIIINGIPNPEWLEIVVRPDRVR